jgi:hypothetical protein
MRSPTTMTMKMTDYPETETGPPTLLLPARHRGGMLFLISSAWAAQPRSCSARALRLTAGWHPVRRAQCNLLFRHVSLPGRTTTLGVGGGGTIVAPKVPLLQARRTCQRSQL